MNLRSIFLRTALVVALFGVVVMAATLAPRLNPDTRSANTDSTPIVFLPLIALPLLHALFAP